MTEPARVVEIASVQLCLCGHPRRDHVKCSDSFPAICVHPEPNPDEGWYGVCPCMQFEDEDGGR